MQRNNGLKRRFQTIVSQSVSGGQHFQSGVRIDTMKVRYKPRSFTRVEPSNRRARCFGCSRLLWNNLLAESQHATVPPNIDERIWSMDAATASLQQSLRDLSTIFYNCLLSTVGRQKGSKIWATCFQPCTAAQSVCSVDSTFWIERKPFKGSTHHLVTRRQAQIKNVSIDVLRKLSRRIKRIRTIEKTKTSQDH